MLINIINSLGENFVKKVRNPFFGTLAVVFTLKNWRLFYSLIYFESGLGRASRIEIIESYITNSGGYLMLAEVVGCTFLALITSYILQGLSAGISNFYDAVMHPWIIGFVTRRKSIVTKEEHAKAELRIKSLEDNIEKERKKRYAAEDELEQTLKKMAELQPKIDEKQVASNIIATKVADYNPKSSTLEKLSRAEKIAKKIFENPGFKIAFKTYLMEVAGKLGYATFIESEELLKSLLLIHGIVAETNSAPGMYYLTDFGQEVRTLFLEKIIESHE